ncbi:MAG: hypothetical protein JSU81_00170 [Candidatus Coatesbacteria bacterium]|nr:MAG: hypothetical protein JSU81_00170 [Candidatus Coatesbacteria bacterium]
MIAATVACGANTAAAVAVNVPTDDFTVNLGLLLQVGHYYRFAPPEYESRSASEFGVGETELRFYGAVYSRVRYDLRFYRFYHVREATVGVELPIGFSARTGLLFVPFGREATTYEGDLPTARRTASSTLIAPGRNYGLRFDYARESEGWPYAFGGAAGVYNGEEPLVDAVGRLYGTPIPGVRALTLGGSFYYGKEERLIYRPDIRDEEYHYFAAPRLGVDLSYHVWRFDVSAEYMQYYIDPYLIDIVRRPGQREYEGVYVSDYYRGYFGIVTYAHPLPWRYLQSWQPYARYERYKRPIIRRGYVPEDRYTAGFALQFVGRTLMLRADYTRVLEEENRVTNDFIYSHFQLMF